MAIRFPLFPSKDRALGVARSHRYDIPLNQGTSRIFLTLLIGLMVFLAALSLTAAFALTQFADRWQTGLEGRWTIELPAVDEQGELRPRSELEDEAEDITTALESFHAIETIEVLSEDDVRELLDPWFDFDEDDKTAATRTAIPLPVLMSLTMRQTGGSTADNLVSTIQDINAEAQLDRHEQWLAQLLKLTGTLRLIALIFTLIICGAAVTAIAGGIQSRMAEHKESVQLLHLMGASDIYIMHQFQRHGVILALQGGLCGFLLSVLMLAVFYLYLAGGGDQSQLPEFEITPVVVLTLLTLPLWAALLAAITARITVLQTLIRMP